jgi:hypothetical protein
MHLPLVGTSFDLVVSQDLSTYPTPFIYNTTLESTAFVLAHNDLESWRNAVQIAAFLANQASGPLTRLSVFYGDAMPVAERSKYHLLVIGRPSQMPIVAEMNNDLPAPFLSNSDIVSEDGNFQVTYRIPPDAPMGYVQMMASPWNSENVVLALLGNTTQGVGWAASALVDSVLRGQLGGNFAVVNDKQIVSSNIRYVETSSGEVPAAEIPNVIASPSNEATPDISTARPEWILPVLFVSIGLIAIIVVVAAIRNRSRINTRKKGKELQRKDGGDSSHGQS